MDAIELLKKIIAIPSFSGEEDKVVDLILTTLADYGYIAERKGNNIWVKSRNFDAAKPTILMDSHLDTVKPNGNWDTDPFAPTVKEGKLYGLGSNDTGGSIVSMLSTFLQLAETEQSFNLIWLGSAEEERAGANGIRSIIEELGQIDLALIGEPTDMQAAIAERGLMVVDCLAKGVSGHAAREEGVNAIYEALADIEWFRNYQFAKESNLLGKVKMSVTGINAGSLHNVVPAECQFMVDVRINEHYSNAEVIEVIQQHIKCEATPRSLTWNSSSIHEEHPIVKRCKELGLTSYGSPTTSNQVAIPYTSLKIGPGQSARSHTANEYIEIKEIEEGIKIFINLLDGFQL